MNLEFVKRVVELDGDIEGTLTKISCGSELCRDCVDCVFSSYNNINNYNCGEDTNQYYLNVAKKYLAKHEVALDTQDRILEFEDGALAELLDLDEKIELNIKEEKKMTLKERILAKIDYSKVAELIYDKLEDEIAEEVAYSYDEEDIANDFVRSYKSELLEVAVDVIKDALDEDIDYDDVQDNFKYYVQEQVDNM